eukprot:UN10725
MGPTSTDCPPYPSSLSSHHCLKKRQNNSKQSDFSWYSNFRGVVPCI